MGQHIEVIASNVHFTHLRNWRELINVILSGEATSTDVDTDMKFASRFQELVKASGYNNHQPFNVDETSFLKGNLVDNLYDKRWKDHEVSIKERV